MADIVNPFKLDPPLTESTSSDPLKETLEKIHTPVLTLPKVEPKVEAKVEAKVQPKVEVKPAVKTIAVEGKKYSEKLARIESILRRSTQSIHEKVRDIDTVIKE